MKSKSAEKDVTPNIAEKLRSDIICGRIAEGSRLTEAEITKRFKVGRGIAREAIQCLSSLGLLQSRPNCGAVVAPTASRETRGVLRTLRRTLEVHALEQIFDELTPADFENWERILNQMLVACEQEDYHAIAEADIEFHHYLMVCAKEPDLLMIWELLIGRMRSHFRRTQRRRCANIMDLHEEHRFILETFRTESLSKSVDQLSKNID